MKEAFSAPYGLLLVNEFAANLGDSADAGCLAAKGIAKTALAGAARTILIRMGVQMFQKVNGLLDREVFKAKFAALKGANAYDELARLADDPDVRAYIELAEPAKLANTANIVLENMDRYLLIQRIRLKRPLTPLALGNSALIDADPTDETEDKLDDFAESKKSAALERYIDLLSATGDAFKQSIDPKVALRFGPRC